MKRWRVLDEFTVKVWVSVFAPTKEEAIEKLETSDHDPEDSDYIDTDWNSLKQDGECDHHPHMRSKLIQDKCLVCGYVVSIGESK